MYIGCHDRMGSSVDNQFIVEEKHVLYDSTMYHRQIKKKNGNNMNTTHCDAAGKLNQSHQEKV